MEQSKRKVLLVEDTPIARKVAVIILNSLGCKIDIAEKGATAIEMATKNQYDLILMDIGLPDMDGLTVTKCIRQRESKGKHVPIIALTAHSETSIKEQIFEVGLDDLLIKPLTVMNGQRLLERYSAKV